jgi:hypothetical protein
MFSTLIVAAACLTVPANAAFIFCPEDAAGATTAHLVGTALGGQMGSPHGFGDAQLTWGQQGDATFNINTWGVPGAHQIGLFRGAPGTAGQQVMPLTDAQHTLQNGRFQRTVTFTDTALAEELRSRPQDFFVRVDSPEFPQGAIRGQLGTQPFLGGFLEAGDWAGATAPAGARGGFTTAFRDDPMTGQRFLDFDFHGTGLGNEFTGLEIWQGDRGTTGLHRLTIGQNHLLQNGRLRGTVALDDQLRRDILANPQNFHFRATGANAAFRGQLGMTHETFIPVFGSVAGANNTRWNSDVRIFNTSFHQDATVFIEYFERGTINEPASMVTTVVIPPRGSVVFDDATANVLFPGLNTLGALRISSNVNVVAHARVYNDQRPDRGTFGQLIPGLSRCAAINRGVLGGLTNAVAGGTQAFNARTNVGFFNPNSQNATIVLQMHNAQGQVIASRTITLGPWQQTQMPLLATSGGLFDTIQEVVTGTLSFHSSAPVFAYGSVIDNLSGDATTLIPQADFSTPDLMN